MVYKFVVALLFLNIFSVNSQPILNKKGDNNEKPHAVEKKPSPGSLVKLVVDNDEARKKWYEKREKSLHDSRNGANGHYIRGKDENEADASAVPAKQSAPVATPMQLIALLKKRRGSKISKSEEHVRVIRQVINPGYQVVSTIGGYPSPYQPQPYVYTSPPPPPPTPIYASPVPTTTLAPPPPPTTPKPSSPKVEETVQSARDEYRKNRFAGSAYALALKLSKAGNTPLSEGGSYSGR